MESSLAVARIIECANIAAGDGIVRHSETWDPDPFGGEDTGDDR